MPFSVAGVPIPGVCAEAGWVLAADLGSGTDDPRPQAPSLIARSVAALPGGLRKPIVRGDSGFFDSGVARAALAAGADFGIAAKRGLGGLAGGARRARRRVGTGRRHGRCRSSGL